MRIIKSSTCHKINPSIRPPNYAQTKNKSIVCLPRYFMGASMFEIPVYEERLSFVAAAKVDRRRNILYI